MTTMQLAFASILRYVSFVSTYSCETNETICPRSVNRNLPDFHFSSLLTTRTELLKLINYREKLKVYKRA